MHESITKLALTPRFLKCDAAMKILHKICQ